MKRLTIHLSGVKKRKVKTKDGDKTKLYNTISFMVADEDEGNSTISRIKEEYSNKVKISKTYYSNVL